MKPKSKKQIRIVELSSKLKPIVKEHKKWAFDKCLDKYYVRARKTLFCLECGYSWKEDSVLITNVVGCTCPKCKRALKLKSYYRSWCNEAAYFSILTTVEDMQVVRMFFIRKLMKKKEKPTVVINEVMQHFIDAKGQVTTMSKTVQGFSQYYDQWILTSDLEVRPTSYQYCSRYAIGPYGIYPDRKILPVIKRNGFKGSFHGFTPHHLFSTILKDSNAETLLKTKQVSLLKYFERFNETVKSNWPSIKICIRNGYIIKDASLWIDYLNLLKQFRRDVLNPFYVCPDDLKKAHDRLVIKRRDLDRKKRLKEMIAKVKMDQKEYASKKRAFFGLAFRKGAICVKAMESVEEFMKEGDELRHCVFTNEYYKRDESLILSARVNDVPVETIEISLKDISVLQARGKNNMPSKYHDKIVDLVKSNLHQIAKRV